MQIIKLSNGNRRKIAAYKFGWCNQILPLRAYNKDGLSHRQTKESGGCRREKPGWRVSCAEVFARLIFIDASQGFSRREKLGADTQNAVLRSV